ncbi:MAG: hypothetical protein HQK78_14480 [Desulfobacterales bacterium]|nr:hypothetical protein [Desulfobacterales bacterium]
MTFTARYLSEKLNINFAKFTRWSREFLPPDPKAGKGKGVYRQYSINDAFTVYLGGHMVGELKLSIPDANMILSDLNSFLVEKSLYPDVKNVKIDGIDKDIQRYVIIIMSKKPYGFYYLSKGKISKKTIDYKGLSAVEEIYFEYPIKKYDNTIYVDEINQKILEISKIRDLFLLTLIGTLKYEDENKFLI